MSPTITWLWWICGTLAAVCGTVLLYRSLFMDRASRGGIVRERCPRCWFDMNGIPGTLCPECGRDANAGRRRAPGQERAALLRTRRRWDRAGAGVVLCAAGICAVCVPVVVQGGIQGVLPTAVVIWCLPDAGAEWQSPAWAGGIPAVPTKHWAAEELGKRISRNELSPSQWRKAIASARVIRARKAWPVDQPLEMQVVLPAWGVNDVVVHPRLAVARTWQTQGSPWATEALPRVLLERGMRTVTCDVVVYGTPGTVNLPFTPAAVIWSGEIDLPLRAVETLQEAIKPTADEGITDALRRSTRLLAFHPGSVYTAAKDPATRESLVSKAISLEIDFGEPPPPELAGVAIGLRCEFRHGTRVIAPETGIVLPTSDDPTKTASRTWDHVVCIVPSEVCREWAALSPEELAKCTVRIFGVNTLWQEEPRYWGVLTEWHADRYWNGSFEIPASELIGDAAAVPEGG